MQTAFSSLAASLRRSGRAAPAYARGTRPRTATASLGCRRTLDDVNAFVRMGQPPTEIVPGLYLGNEGNASDVACQRARRADGTDAVGCDLFVFCLLLVFVASLGASDLQRISHRIIISVRIRLTP